tara:strand:- start:663 stop:908 length:246 start_codon:yes stop_codon:yes gene_type:complete
MSHDAYEIKVVSGSKNCVDNLIEYELREYPKKEYGTVVLDLEENDYMKTVRIVRFRTKELCNGQQLVFEKGVYPFDSGVSL